MKKIVHGLKSSGKHPLLELKIPQSVKLIVKDDASCLKEKLTRNIYRVEYWKQEAH